MSEDSNSTFQFDVHRAVVLGHYIRFWGLPKSRYSARLHDGSRLEVYAFASPTEKDAYRFATVGASAVHPGAPTQPNWELFMAVPSDLCGANQSSIFGLMADLAAYGTFGNVVYQQGVLMPEVPSIPSAWPTRTIAIDSPLCEPKDFSPIHVGGHHVNLFWVVLVHTSEQQLIQEAGMDALYKQCDAQGWHPTDPRRPPLA